MAEKKWMAIVCAVIGIAATKVYSVAATVGTGVDSTPDATALVPGVEPPPVPHSPRFLQL